MIAPLHREPVVLTDARGNVKGFSYDALQDTGKRKAGPKKTVSEDGLLPKRKRETLSARCTDQARNMSLVAWMIRKHVKNVSQFNFLFRTPSDRLNTLLQRRFDYLTSKEGYDRACRHDMNRAFMLFELDQARKGDAFQVFQDTGDMHLVDADLVCYPDDGKLPKRWENRVNKETGLVVDKKTGKTTHICICRYDGKKKVFSYVASADNLLTEGNFTGVSQTRGVSPLTSALNSFADLKESHEWTLLKIKVHALLAFAFSRDGVEDGMPTLGAHAGDVDADGAEYDEPRYSLDLSSNVLNLDLDEGDKVDMLESKTPFQGTRDFWDSVIRIGLLSFDIPYTMYDGRGSSFSHVKMDRSEYFHTVQGKQAANGNQLKKWRDWQLDAILEDTDSAVAKALQELGDSYSAEELKEDVEIVPVGAPWLDQKEELETLHLELAAGVNSRTNFCRAHNRDFKKICADLEREQKEMNACGIKYTVGIPGADVSNQEPQQEEEQENE